MKHIFLFFFLFLAYISCNSPEQNTAVGNSQDSVTVNNDSLGPGSQGPGVDNSGGVPAPDTARGKGDSVNTTPGKPPVKVKG